MKSEIQYFLNKSPYGNKQLQYHKPHTPEKPDQYYTKKEIDYLLKNIDISNKVDKEEGKGLSTNDYTTDDKNKLNTLPTNKVLTTILNGKVDTADLAEVATSGSYNDLSDKPTIPAAQVQSDWNESDTTSKAYIKNKPTIPTVPTNVSAFNNDAGYITASYVAAKQDKMSIVQVASGTTAINAAINTYYEVTGEVGTIAITLPEPTDTTKVAIVVIHLLAGTTPNVVIGSTAVIDYSSAYDISAGNEYEINCLFNGDKWVIADMEVL